MPGRASAKRHLGRGGPRSGSSSEDMRRWGAIYESTPYDELPWFDPEPSPPVRRAVTDGFLTPRTTVLDLGCGAGSNVLFLSSQGFDSRGIDLAPGAVRAAQGRATKGSLRIDVRVGDALATGFRDDQFDALIDIGCFHTIPLDRRGDYRTEVARILRPNGHFVLSWVAREHEEERGPPHRPSLEEVATALESEFLFQRTGFHPPGEAGGPAVYDAWLVRRASPQPPPR